jgi:NAD-dependent dihydropyrimidine dehydrogenase PreA subunit
VTDCGQTGLSQHKYDAAQRTCETACPNGFIAYEPSTTANWYCVKKCPANYYLML